MEKILSIEEFETENNDWSNPGYSGFKIITEKQEIKLAIDDHHQCCEEWGYFWCNDDTEQFIGAELREIRITDTALNQVRLEKNDGGNDLTRESFEGGIMFVNLETDRGTLQFVAYNDHNGYYGHRASVESTQLTHSETL